jgi:exopolysaccharide biosynthesis polyprenyl glycosylphosphotransferase
MLKQQSRLLNRIAVFVDVVMVVAAYFSAYMVMRHFTNLHGRVHYDWILLYSIPVLLYLIKRSNLYASLRTREFSDLFLDLLKAHIIGAFAVASLIYLIKPEAFSRLLFGGCFAFSFIFICISKQSIRIILYYLRLRGYNVRHLLLAGCNETSAEMIGLIRRHPEWGLVIVGITEDEPHGEELFFDVAVVGTVDDIPEFCKNNPVDEVIWCLEQDTEELLKVFQKIGKMGITFRSVLDYSHRPSTRVDLELFHGQFQLLTFYNREFNFDQLFAKRCLDVAGSLAGLLFTALLFPLVALAIKLESPGPVLFGQMRMGANGRKFRCWKFRSMCMDAEKGKQELMDKNEMQGALFKIADDPRVTRVGRFIRRTSIDELPQFWNVLKGEMSLVGTRPPTLDEVGEYEYWHHKRISMKPGITGLWQVSGRNQIQDFDKVARLDIQYIDNWSFWVDVRILLKTVWVVFARSGAV